MRFPRSGRLFLLGSALLCSALTSPGAEAPRIVRLRADNWMPYNGDPDAALPGYVVEVARLIFGARGITLDYQTMPWTDALKAAAAGEIEGVIGANQNEARALFLPHEPIGQPATGLFVRTDSKLKFENLNSLKTARLGVIEGYSYWETLDTYIARQTSPQINFFKGDTPLLDAIAQLDTGGLDVVAEILPVWIWNVRASGRSNKDYRSIYLQPGEPIYVAFSPGRGPELSAIFVEGLAELRASGKLAEILQKYSLTDWK